ncbi:hypothetical protein FSARC_11952 [Fusarium sarcochroum]|uniref:Calcineurin-like phosphoesterase domain-containing protein n=1 Tax=Fusarium sarcochroum TaxID=1208366 RepID=A0A8H4TBP9_9HYPO|nr:hypothetical protein FSARC_11952 [Fusarium sarcochroum]
MSIWCCIDKDLYQYQSPQSAYLYMARANERDLAAEDLVLTDIRIGGPPPNSSSNYSWETRAAGIWVLRGIFGDTTGRAVTEVDVLFGPDAVDPRPHWTLLQDPLELDHQSKVLAGRLSVLRGRAKSRPDSRHALRVREDGTFKIVQISDTHMVTGVGVCKDAIDAFGKDVPECDADPLTVSLIESVLDAEEPDLVVLTGDQLHHDISDSQSALFKVVAPIIKRSIPFAAVFGNHDSEGIHALSRRTQMSILENLPLSFCDSGPDDVDGVGNFCLEILASVPSQQPLLTLYFLDSHGQISGSAHKPGYDSISQNQIKWFTDTSQAKRLARETGENDNEFHISLAFLHIPLPEFSDCRLRIHSGQREEPTEGPSLNTHLYDALVEERPKNSRMVIQPLNEALGYAMQVAAGLVVTAHMTAGDLTEECGFGKLIQGVGA